MRVAMSRPVSSVPRMCTGDGPCRRSARTGAFGSYPDRPGPRSAIRTKATTSNAPRPVSRLRNRTLRKLARRALLRSGAAGAAGGARTALAIPYARVEIRVQHVDQQVQDEKRGGEQQSGRL